MGLLKEQQNIRLMRVRTNDFCRGQWEYALLSFLTVENIKAKRRIGSDPRKRFYLTIYNRNNSRAQRNRPFIIADSTPFFFLAARTVRIRR